MTKDHRPAAETTPRAGSVRRRAPSLALLGYVVVLSLVTFALLAARTDLDQLADDALLLSLFLLISVVAETLGFSLGADVETSLGGLFDGAAALTLGYNGVWVRVLTNLFWLLKRERPATAGGCSSPTWPTRGCPPRSTWP